MRRKDKMQDSQKAIEIMQNAAYCVLSASPSSVCGFEPDKKAYKENGSLSPDYQIFSIPVSFVYHQNQVFIHTAKAGRKISFFNDGSLVCLVFVGHVQVPEIYNSHEELEQLAQTDPKKLGSHVFTTEYESTIAYGRIFALNDKESQDRAMMLLCQKYTPDKMEFVQMSVDMSRKHLNVYAIELEHISAKAKYFDS